MPWIDAHSHVWSTDLERYPLAPGFQPEAVQPRSFTPEELLRVCRPEGVNRVVLIQVSFHGFDNRYILDQMERFPGVFGAVGCVDAATERPDEAMLALSRRGVRGFRVRQGNSPPERWIEGPGYERMFRCAADHGLAICPLMEPSGLPSLSRMCSRHLKTRVVIDHLGRVGFTGEIREDELHALAQMSHFPEVRVKVSAFYALGKKRPPHTELEPMIRRLHRDFGPRRLMWASDSPFQVVQAGYGASIGLVRDRLPWLSGADREWMLRRCAEEVFFRGLPAPPAE